MGVANRVWNVKMRSGGHCAPFSGYPVSTIDVINCRVRDFFNNLVAHYTDNCLCYILPDMRDSIITNGLRSANKFPLIFAKTNKFVYLLGPYGLSNYQLTTAWHCRIFVCYLQCMLLYCTNPACHTHTPINSKTWNQLTQLTGLAIKTDCKYC